MESRNEFTGSNLRGHLYLQVTDHARSPHAMGGQPEIILDPDQVLRWSWRLDWYEGLADLHASRPAPLIDADGLAAEVGRSLPVRVAAGATLSEPAPITSAVSGVHHVVATAGGRSSRISVFFHQPLRRDRRTPGPVRP